MVPELPRFFNCLIDPTDWSNWSSLPVCQKKNFFYETVLLKLSDCILLLNSFKYTHVKSTALKVNAVLLGYSQFLWVFDCCPYCLLNSILRNICFQSACCYYSWRKLGYKGWVMWKTGCKGELTYLCTLLIPKNMESEGQTEGTDWVEEVVLDIQKPRAVFFFLPTNPSNVPHLNFKNSWGKHFW